MTPREQIALEELSTQLNRHPMSPFKGGRRQRSMGEGQGAIYQLHELLDRCGFQLKEPS